jgi:hypothetical protein
MCEEIKNQSQIDFLCLRGSVALMAQRSRFHISFNNYRYNLKEIYMEACGSCEKAVFMMKLSLKSVLDDVTDPIAHSTSQVYFPFISFNDIHSSIARECMRMSL